MIQEDLKLNNHKHISNEILKKILRNFKAIDHALNIFYLTSNSDPQLDEILKSATLLFKKKIEQKDLLEILTIAPDCYQIDINEKRESQNFLVLKYPSNITVKNLHKRISEFIKKINKWIEVNPECINIKESNIYDLIRQESKNEIPSNLRNNNISHIKKNLKFQFVKKKLLSSILKKNKSSFNFVQKNEIIEQRKNKGLTLLERIKLKEKINKDLGPKKNQDINIENDYEKKLLNQICKIYDIIYHLKAENNDNNISKTFSLFKFCEIAKDSLTCSITNKEIIDTIELISKKLDYGKVKVITKNNLHIVKINNLNRENDIKLL